MKYLFVLSFLLVTPLLAQTAKSSVITEGTWEQNKYWSEVNDLDGRFQLLSPAPFAHRVDTLDGGLGEQVLHTFHFEVPDPTKAENVIYALSYVDYPVGSLHHDSTELIEEFMASTEEEAVIAMRGDLVYASGKEVSTYPARQWRIDYNDGKATARTLAVVAGNRYYELKVFSLKASGPNGSASKFFDSFRLFDPPGEQ
ncbi:hypothetical protein [Neolewinella antarctica]|uniref:Uncharacterized protein n=1 Tax=Neolewinella antarctica TaxID=442734 RepID=A0ABX0XB98_9BACT|nr:hypothetical protein [Neolewinella antarctica]NJC26224.1 hypothetical protein [Neolewinella antarctica]